MSCCSDALLVSVRGARAATMNGLPLRSALTRWVLASSTSFAAVLFCLRPTDGTCRDNRKLLADSCSVSSLVLPV